MADELNWLLTDEFVSFSAKIAAIHEKKKAKKQELKEFYEKIQTELKTFDSQAKDAEDEFQKWKKSLEETKDE